MSYPNAGLGTGDGFGMSWRGAKVTGHSKAAIHQIAYRQKGMGR